MIEDFIKEVANFIVWLVIAPLVWFIKRLVGRVDKIENDINHHKTKVAEEYMPREEVSDNFKTLNGKLDRMLEHLINGSGKGGH
jgi:TM2 domain-containing membrane protein YozV